MGLISKAKPTSKGSEHSKPASCAAQMRIQDASGVLVI